MEEAKLLIKYGEEGYYTTDHMVSEFVDDLLTGRVKIYQVPQAVRMENRDAYTYACRWARDSSPKDVRHLEKKLIEHCLIRDILDAYGKGKEGIAQRLFWEYKNYFSDDGMSLYDPVYGLL